MNRRQGAISHQQCGRSMIEMLGVLAVVGVLSVGVLAGYSTAMTNYKANKAIDEIRKFYSDVRDLYANKNDYTGFHCSQLCTSGFWDDCNGSDIPQNMFGTWIPAAPMTAWGNSHFALPYQFGTLDKPTKEKICQKILLAGWDTELGNNLDRIYVN